MSRFTFSEDDFKHLVAGGTLEMETESGEKVQVALADIGFHRMAHLCASSGANHDNKVGRIRKVE